MEAISSNPLSKLPKLMNVSPHRLMRAKSPQPKITANSSFTTFQSIKKKLITLNKPQAHEGNTKQSLLASIFNSLDEFICTYIDDSPLHPSIDPNHVLSDHFSPVDELPPTACEVVEGSIPPCLEGAYIRNGPNPQFTPHGPYHLFDGDGMLHMIKISKCNKPTLCSRYVKTYKHFKEREIGYPFFPSIFASFNGLGPTVVRLVLTATRVLVRQFDPLTYGFGTANTNLALFGGALFALAESDLPYAIKVTSEGDIVTLGRHNFQSNEPFFWMTAHPKVDRNTGEAFAYSYNTTHPFLTFFRINSEGKKQKDVHINSVKRLTVIHDFAITQNYAVFPDLQIVVNPLDILRGKSPVGVDGMKIPRLGIIPRYAEDESEMWWVDTPGFNLLHTVNAWEEDGGDTIVLVASNPSSVEQVLEGLDSLNSSLEKIIIDVKAKTVQRHVLSNHFLEFGVINPAYATKRNRYVYAAVLDHPKRVKGVMKLDLSLSAVDCVVASHLYGPSCCGGELFFVAKESNNLEAKEDDGYLVSYVTDENTKESKFIVMDAMSPSLEIIAAVKLPQRVPCGFHGIFVHEEHLRNL